MRICLIAEGCYPYVAGGVSAWVQMLIEGMPEHEFVLFTIGAEESQRGQYKYTLPKNVVEVKEHFLDEVLSKPKKKFRKTTLTNEEKQALSHFIEGHEVNFAHFFSLPDSRALLESADFLEVVKAICQNKYATYPFNEVFWTIRSMLLPLLEVLECDLPEADLYHSVSTGYAGIVAAKAKWKTEKPFILTEHGIYTREREEEILKADWVQSRLKGGWIQFFMSMSAAAYSYSDATISLFEHAKTMQIELGAKSEVCKVIPNGIKIERFKEVGELAEQSDELIIGAIVRVVPIKDIKTMIYSFELVKRMMPKAKLYIIGPYDENPEYYEECQQLIERLGCKDIIFTGRVKVEEWMGKLDLVILTSVSEGQPFVLLEAMAARRPVISTDVGCCREIIEGNDDSFGMAGMTVSVMNPQAMATAMIKLGKNRKLMKEMGNNGYQRVKNYYQQSDFLRNYAQLYEEVMA